MAQFKGSYITMKKSEATRLRNKLSQAKCYDDASDFVNNSWTGAEVFREIVQAIESRPPREHRLIMAGKLLEIPAADVTSTPLKSDTSTNGSPSEVELPGTVTPEGTQNPEPPGSGAPLLPNERRKPLPSIITGQNALTPTPTPNCSQSAL